MDSPDQRRKRKRILRQYYSPSSSYYYSLRHLLSVRSLATCFGFLIFLYLLSCKNPFTASAFRPVSAVSNSSSLSSFSSRTVKSVRDFKSFFSPSEIDSRVLFPDRVLLLVRGVKKNRVLECVYYDKFGGFDTKKPISVDVYDGVRSIVGCPLPSSNHSNFVNLKLGKNRILGQRNVFLVSNQTFVNSWENLAYEAVLDGEDVVVFVKGLNLRPGRESDPSPFSCHFGLGKSRKNSDNYILSTKALTAAQEVVRCPLPRRISSNLDKAEGIRVTIGSNPRRRSNGHALIPSVAKISDLRSDGDKKKKKHNLCVCTMVWNQASAIREWIVYHSWLGVEKWFIYDNNSDDNIEEAIKELGNHYNITRHVWPWIKTQEAGFSHCALRSKSECNWVSFMDVDEYFYFPYSTPDHQLFRSLGYASQNSLRELVVNISSSLTNIGEIRTSCLSFGPSGLNSRPKQGVTVGYTCRLHSPERHKSIVNPEVLDPTLMNVVHHFRLRKGYRYLNLPQSVAVVNHYKYQVWEVFRAKFYRRVATYVADWKEKENEGSRDRAPGLGTEAIEPPDWPRKFCEVWDTGLRDFVLGNLADGLNGLLPWETGFGLIG